MLKNGIANFDWFKTYENGTDPQNYTKTIKALSSVDAISYFQFKNAKFHTDNFFSGAWNGLSYNTGDIG
jgi:hypothetical protein